MKRMHIEKKKQRITKLKVKWDLYFNVFIIVVGIRSGQKKIENEDPSKRNVDQTMGNPVTDVSKFNIRNHKYIYAPSLPRFNSSGC